MADITVCLLNWKRPGNFPRVLDSISSQTVQARIFLWDNGETPVEDTRIDWMVRSSRNLICWPRWFMAVQAETDYVCTLDDDLCFSDPHVLRDGIEAAERVGPDQLVGPFARILAPDLSYSGGFSVRGPMKDRIGQRPVDVIKGRHIIAKTRALKERLPLHAPTPPEDDIAVSGLMAGGRRLHHVRPGVYGHRLARFQELPAPFGRWKAPGHAARRDETAGRYFEPGAQPPGLQPSSLRERKKSAT